MTPTAHPVDLAARLDRMAGELMRAREPAPLGAFDAIDLRAAAAELRRLRDWIATPDKPLPVGVPVLGCWKAAGSCPCSVVRRTGPLTWDDLMNGCGCTAPTHWKPLALPPEFAP